MTPTLKEARRLHALGFGIHWIYPKAKNPVELGWTKGERATWDFLEKSYRRGFNVGVALGPKSQIGKKFLAVIDVDIKSGEERHRLEARAALKKIVDTSKCPLVLSGRGGGSRHYYFLTDTPQESYNLAWSDDEVRYRGPGKTPSKRERGSLTAQEIERGIRLGRAWEISFMSQGRQVVLPPSIHPDSGEEYRWKRPVRQISDLPRLTIDQKESREAVISGVEGSSGVAGKTGNSARREGATGDSQAVLERRGVMRSERPTPEDFQFKIEKVELDWLPISNEVRQGILKGTGVTDRSAYLLKASSALLSAGLTANEALNVLTDPTTYLGQASYEHAQTKSRIRAAAWVHRYTVRRIAKERSGKGDGGESVFAVPPRKAKRISKEAAADQEAEMERLRDWRQGMDRTQKGGTRPTLKNLDLIFTHGVKGACFEEDVFASRIQYGCDTPWGGKAGEFIQDIDMIRAKAWLSASEFQVEPNTAAILEAASLVAHKCRVHPVREWLKNLKWDGVARIDTWLRDYCNARGEEPYLSEVSRKFLLAMVKRVFEPGCQWDYVIVLEGPQGKFKSSAARALAGEKWFMDNLPDLKDKDAMLNLQGKWLIELGELADVKKADYNLVKAYLVRRTDTVRPHYGRLKVDMPRQSVFVGTINEGQYLRDPTGNRRYWPVKVDKCDVVGLTAARSQLFAEAMDVYLKREEQLFLSPEANFQATRAQEDRRVDDDESEMREAFLTFCESEKSAHFNFTRFKFVDLTTGVSAPWGKWATTRGGYAAQIASHVLTSLGYLRKKSHGQRYWSRMEPEKEVVKERGTLRGNAKRGTTPVECENFL